MCIETLEFEKRGICLLKITHAFRYASVVDLVVAWPL